MDTITQLLLPGSRGRWNWSATNTGVPVEEAMGDAAYAAIRQAFSNAGRTLIARVRTHFPKEDST